MLRRLFEALAARSKLTQSEPLAACVGRGAWVNTPGKKRLIEELVVGDEIIAVEPKTGEHVVTTITAIVSAEKECGMLRLADGTTLSMAETQPVFDPSDLAFHPAGEWFSGERSSLLRFNDGKFQLASVAERTPFFDIRTVFDLTVESPWQTFVADGVVVHNKTEL